LIYKFGGEFAGYLRDESRVTGKAEFISFPSSIGEIKRVLSEASSSARGVTIQGGRTGIAAGAVPFGGYILNLDRMNRITGMRYDPAADRFFVLLQPGVTLSELRRILENRDFDTTGWTGDSLEALEKFKGHRPCFFSPDPTETSASIGGMTACNASGARSFFYGPVRKFIESLRIILADGDELLLKRGRNKAVNRSFRLEALSGRVIEGILPNYRMPSVKNATGYYIEDDMDLIDLFVGSEGTLGVIAEIEIRLLPLPASMWGMMAFFGSEENAVRFVRETRQSLAKKYHEDPTPRLAAVEYFNKDALNLLRKQKMDNPAFAEIPEMKPEFHTAVYTEYHGGDDDAVGETVMKAAEILAGCGGSEDDTWMASDEREMGHIHFFRHAVPEAVNLTIDEKRKIDPRLAKLGTDMAVPDEHLEKTLAMYNKSLQESGLESVMFGHIGNNHIHVNILPNSMEEYNMGKKLYIDWAGKVVRMGGTISAEHGVGKLKTALLREMYGDDGIGQMKAVKKTFDPQFILNRGTLFEC